MRLKQIAASSIVTGAIFLAGTITPAFADSVNVSGNGAGSLTGVSVSNKQSTELSQSNSANISNVVVTSANTGGNQANDNTGGNTDVSSGNTNATVAIDNNANLNSLATNGNLMSSTTNNTNVGVNGNGAGSENFVDVNNSQQLKAFQQNTAQIQNQIKAMTNTGNNSSNNNTGNSNGMNWNTGCNGNVSSNNNSWGDMNNAGSNSNGSNTVTSGSANSFVSITNDANANSM